MRRRRVIALSGAVLTAGCGTVPGVGSRSDPTDSPTLARVSGRYAGLQRGPQHDGAIDGAVGDRLAAVWSRREPSDATGHTLETPAVRDGTVYVPEGTVRNGTATASLTARDGVTGAREWQFEVTGTNAVAPAVVADGHAFQLFSGVLVAVDVATGTDRWRLDADLDTTPTAADGRVFVAGASLDGETLYALDSTTGDELWTRDLDANGPGALATPAVADGTVYLPAGEAVIGLDAATGTEQWAVSLDHRPRGVPTVTDDALYVPTVENGIAAIDRARGEQTWWTDVATAGTGGGRIVPASPAVADGVVYTTSLWALTALEAATGERRWTIDAGATGPSVVTDARVFVGGIDSLRGFAVDDGALAVDFRTENETGSATPALVDGVAYYPSDALYALVGV